MSPTGSPQHEPARGAKEDVKWKKWYLCVPPHERQGLWERTWKSGQDRERWKVWDEVCADIALDVVNISLSFVTDQNLDWHDQSA